MFPLKQQIRCTGGFWVTLQKKNVLRWRAVCLLSLSPAWLFYVKQASDDFKACLKSSSLALHKEQICFQTCGANIAAKNLQLLFHPVLSSLIQSWQWRCLTSIDIPTGVVTSLHGDMNKAITVDIESSSREKGNVNITSNLSSIISFYTMVQE